MRLPPEAVLGPLPLATRPVEKATTPVDKLGRGEEENDSTPADDLGCPPPTLLSGYG